MGIIIGISRPCAGCWLWSSDWRRRAGRSRRSLRKKATKQDDDRSKDATTVHDAEDLDQRILVCFLRPVFFLAAARILSTRFGYRRPPLPSVRHRLFAWARAFAISCPPFFAGCFFPGWLSGHLTFSGLATGHTKCCAGCSNGTRCPANGNAPCMVPRFPVFYRLSAPAQPS